MTDETTEQANGEENNPWPIAATAEVINGEVNGPITVTAMTEWLTEHPEGNLVEKVRERAADELADGEVTLEVHEPGTVSVVETHPFNLETDGGEPADEHLTRVHTDIGNRPGVIVELRNAEHADDPACDRDMTHLSVQDATELYNELGDALELETAHQYQTKTVRVHEPEKGQYVYVMMTQFNGEGAVLGEPGFTGTYIWYQVVSQNKMARVGGSDPWALARRHPGDWFPESTASELMKALDMDEIQWSDLTDGDYLTPEDVDALKGEDTDTPEVVTDGGSDVFYAPRDLSVPADEADGYLHTATDTCLDPVPGGGYWIPVSEENSERKHVPDGHVVQFPKDKRPPERRGPRDVPDHVQNWDHREDSDSAEALTDGGQRVPKTLTGGPEVYETEQCDGAGDDGCIRDDPELTRGEDEIHVTEFGPGHSESGRRVLCGECKDKKTALFIADNPDIASAYADELADLQDRFPDILGDVDIPVTDGGRESTTWDVSSEDDRVVLKTGRVENYMTAETAREMAEKLSDQAESLDPDEPADEDGEEHEAVADGGRLMTDGDPAEKLISGFAKLNADRNRLKMSEHPNFRAGEPTDLQDRFGSLRNICAAVREAPEQVMEAVDSDDQNTPDRIQSALEELGMWRTDGEYEPPEPKGDTDNGGDV